MKFQKIYTRFCLLTPDGGQRKISIRNSCVSASSQLDGIRTGVSFGTRKETESLQSGGHPRDERVFEFPYRRIHDAGFSEFLATLLQRFHAVGSVVM